METHMYILKQLLKYYFRLKGWPRSTHDIDLDNERGKRLIQLYITDEFKE